MHPDLVADIATLTETDSHERSPLARVAIVGGGAMGSGIALACARAGMRVVVKDLNDASLGRARTRIDGTLASVAKSAAGGSNPGPAAVAESVWSRLTLTTDYEAISAADLIIEAVFESSSLKHRVLREIDLHRKPDALVASNTSTLPITDLAVAVATPSDFLGIHFFSPVHRMRLVEIIPGARTGPEAVARALTFVQQLGKVPIVVGDKRGFFASRVFGTYIHEGVSMLTEGVAADVIEAAGRAAGFPAPPLAMSDAVAISLSHKVNEEAREAARLDGEPFEETPAMTALARMTELGRHGRDAGAGFYDYPADGPKRLWDGLAGTFATGDRDVSDEDLRDRLRFVMVVESMRCLREGVLRTERDADVGSVLGIGFPAELGGVMRFARHYPGGLDAFLARARELAHRYGPRFMPPEFN